ncbi:hypothetical protein OC835_006041 [Tilletia horrida]|nr:hypothetical protein OC835_006041 [Tilletia horrida]
MTSLPELPAFATVSLVEFSEFIETFVYHRLPRPYLYLTVMYAVLHLIVLLILAPIFAEQLKSGRFWMVRLVPTKRGSIIVPNYLDASATLVAIYVLYDIGYVIKLLLTCYNVTSQHNIPLLFTVRFMVLTTIGWIFLLGFFLVRVPPSAFVVPAFLWNIGIFAIPCGIHFGTLFLLLRANKHWNTYWALYLELRPNIDQALSAGRTMPSAAQVDTASRMIGVELASYSSSTLRWASPYYAWATCFGVAILVLTLDILFRHWGDLQTSEAMPMQTGGTITLQKSARTQRSATVSAGIRRWIRNVPVGSQLVLNVSAHGEPTITDAQDGQGAAQQGPGLQRNGRPMRKMLLYGLGLQPLATDAYNDPAGGFSERRARSSLRLLLIHTAIQGGSIFLIAIAQVSAVFVLTRPGFQQPLDTGRVPGWGVEWVKYLSVVKLLESYGTAVFGLVLFISILMRQLKAIELAKGRANAGAQSQGEEGYTAGLVLSAPGPSASCFDSTEASKPNAPRPHSTVSAGVTSRYGSVHLQVDPHEDGPGDKCRSVSNHSPIRAAAPASHAQRTQDWRHTRLHHPDGQQLATFDAPSRREKASSAYGHEGKVSEDDSIIEDCI